MKFSTFYGLNQGQAGLDFVDVDPDEDMPLFFDPVAIGNLPEEFARQCMYGLNSFFQQVLIGVHGRNHSRAKSLLTYLKEPNEYCFGYSQGRPSGRGIGRIQADKLYQRFAASQAAKTGKLTDLSECELFVEGIGPDKISDITANVLRGYLIQYTQEQCRLHGIEMVECPTSAIWDVPALDWTQDFSQLPTINGIPVILSPKRMVRWTGELSYNHRRYYDAFVSSYLQDYHLSRNTTGMVHILKRGGTVVFKKTVQKAYPLSKDFLFRFSQENPAVFARYRKQASQTKIISNGQLDDDFSDDAFVTAVISELRSIASGTKSATRYHRLITCILEYLFYPTLAYPRNETPINEQRKRIDITYTNTATDGFFKTIASQHQIPCPLIMIECKNYSSDVSNPEIDQLAGRFSPNRGRFGLLVMRHLFDRKAFIQRCRDVTSAQNGYIVGMTDEDILSLLGFAKEGKRSLIDQFMAGRFSEILC